MNTLEITQPDTPITLEVALGVPAGDLGTMASQNADDVNITGGQALLNFLEFSTTAEHAVSQGQLAWNADEETLDLGVNGIAFALGQETDFHVRNGSGQTISKGTAVMATGTVGGSGRIVIGKMDGSNIENSKFFLGIAAENILAGEDGKVKHFGKIRNVNTNAYNEGDVLWVSASVLGGLQNTQPTTIKLPMAFVISKGNNGTIFVRATSGVKLKEAHDVQITNPQNGDILVYSNGVWINQQP
jgi:outer membrane protein assembly factor BamB